MASVMYLLVSVFRFRLQLERMNPSILHGFIQRPVNQPMPIQQILPLKAVRDDADRQVIHGTRSVGHRYIGVGEDTSNIGDQRLCRNHSGEGTIADRRRQRQGVKAG